jgi:hypothetical protein
VGRPFRRCTLKRAPREWYVGRVIRLFIAVVILCAGVQAADWQSLFNGKDLSRWSDPRDLLPPGDAWTVEDGCIKACSKARIVEDLFSRDTFRDFELEFEWRIAPGGNSGVKYRIQDHVFVLDRPGIRFEDLVNRSLADQRQERPERGYDYVVGFEYQLVDREHPDAKTGLIHITGAVYDMVAPSRDASRPAGQFNQSRIVLRGSRVEHWLNGVKVVDAELNSPEVFQRIAKRWGKGSPVSNLLTMQPKRACPISLQNHGDEAWFRNIRIRPLD